MYYTIDLTLETRLRHWTRTGDWLSAGKTITFTAHDVDAAIREYFAYGVGARGDSGGCTALTWRVVRNDDGTFALRSYRRYLDLDDDAVEKYLNRDWAFYLRELERDAREWRAARDALALLDAQKEARS